MGWMHVYWQISVRLFMATRVQLPLLCCMVVYEMSTRIAVISACTCCTNNAQYTSILMLCSILIILPITFNFKFLFTCLWLKMGQLFSQHKTSTVRYSKLWHYFSTQYVKQLIYIQAFKREDKSVLETVVYWKVGHLLTICLWTSKCWKGDTTYLCIYPSLKYHVIYFLATSYPVFSSPCLIKCNLCRYWTVNKGKANSHSATIKLHVRASWDDRWLQLTFSYSLYTLSRIIYIWGFFYHIPHWVHVLFFFTYY